MAAPELITEGSNKSAAFKCFIIGAYDLPMPPAVPGSTTTSPPSPNSKASLPLVTCTLSTTTLSTSTPKSKHPTNRSYRFDAPIMFNNMPLGDVFNEIATFKVVQQGERRVQREEQAQCHT